LACRLYVSHVAGLGKLIAADERIRKPDRSRLLAFHSAGQVAFKLIIDPSWIKPSLVIGGIVLDAQLQAAHIISNNHIPAGGVIAQAAGTEFGPGATTAQGADNRQCCERCGHYRSSPSGAAKLISAKDFQGRISQSFVYTNLYES
jgi:hypothetical protein